MNALQVTGLILLIITLLLFMPASVRLSYADSLSAELRYLGYKRPIYPLAEKSAKKKDKKNAVKQSRIKETEEKKQKNRPAKIKAMDIFAFIMDSTTNIAGAVRLMFSGIIVRNLRLFIILAGDDPYDTGVRCGRYNAIIHGTCAMLGNYIKIKKADIVISADFLSGEDKTELNLKVHIIPIMLLAAGIRLIFGVGASLVKMRMVGSGGKTRQSA